MNQPPLSLSPLSYALLNLSPISFLSVSKGGIKIVLPSIISPTPQPPQVLKKILLVASEVSANLYCNSHTCVLGRLRDYLRLLMKRALCMST